MVRILGTVLNSKQKLYIALTSIYGIGISTSKKILKTLKINLDIKVNDLNEDDISKLRDYLEGNNFKLDGDLERLVASNIAKLIDINSIRGRRHLKGLPVRGQRTRTNSRTSRKRKITNSLKLGKSNNIKN